MVYCLTINGVLPNNKWCTGKQGTVYSLTNLGVLSAKPSGTISLQNLGFSDLGGALPVIVVYIIVV